MDTIESILKWQAKARPVPTEDDARIAAAVHFEEIGEMFDSLYVTSETYDEDVAEANYRLAKLSNALKKRRCEIKILDREAMLDALADQIVTAIGLAHALGMDIVEALKRVDASNWTKVDLVTGDFIRDETGKIVKPVSYIPPNLEGLF